MIVFIHCDLHYRKVSLYAIFGESSLTLKCMLMCFLGGNFIKSLC